MAKALLRVATEVASQDWRCWCNLGRFHGAVAIKNASAIARGAGDRSGGGPSLPPLEAQEKEVWRARALQAAAEAKACFDQAVKVAPEEPEPYLHRAGYAAGAMLAVRSLMEPGGDEALGKHPLLEPRVIADLKAVADKDPENVGAIATAAFFQVVSVAQECHLSLGSEGCWPSLPDDCREYARGAMRRLSDLSNSADSNTASAAFVSLGALEFLLRLDMARAEHLLRRALERDDRLDAPWEMLCGICVSEDRWEEAARVCERRVLEKDSARMRLFLAKIRFKQRNEAEAAKQVEAALRLDPKHRMAQLSSVALRLRRAEDRRALGEVAELMRRLGAAWGDSMTQEERYEYALLHALGAGLAGQREQAIELLRGLRDANPEDQRCQEALAALGNL